MSTPTRVEELLNGALEFADPARRAAYLDHACADDPALRQEVERLLKAVDEGGSALEPPPRPNADRTICVDSQPARPGEVSGVLIAGRYKLLEQIGEGGMGTVWLVEQTQPVRRKVALKLVKAGMDTRQVLARFEAERQALAVMDHPNIAKVLDGGMTDDGRPFFVMEYVKGVPITDYCDTAKLTVEDRLKLLVPVCEAVQHAHQKGIVHRDLKPSNVLVCLYDGKPVPKVIDFGLAKAMHQPLTEQTMFTGHGMVLGTPLYMSPEQAELNNLDIDTRSDVYSLGVILYELLTGTTPLERKRFHEAAWVEMLRLIKEEEPPRPSLRLSSDAALPSLAAQRGIEPGKLSRLLRGELDWVVLKALEKDRSRRYGSPSDLAGDLRRYLAGDLVQARPPSAGYRARKFVRKHRAAVGFVVAITSMLAVATTVSTWQAIAARRAEARAVRSATEAETARAAETKARVKAEDQAFALKFLDGRRIFEQQLNLEDWAREVDLEASFLNMVDSIREAPATSPAWREFAIMYVLFSGIRLGEPLPLPGTPGQFAIDAVVSPDGRQVVVQSENGVVEIRSFPDLAFMSRIRGLVRAGTGYYTPDGFFLDEGRLFCTIAQDRRHFLFWDSKTGQQVGPPLECRVWGERIPITTARSRRLLSFLDLDSQDIDNNSEKVGNRRVSLWHVGTPNPIATIDTGPIEDETKNAWDWVISPNGSWFAISNRKSQAIEIRSGSDGAVIHRVTDPNVEEVRQMSIDDSGRFLALRTSQEIRILDSVSWDRPAEIITLESNKWPWISWLPGSDQLILTASEDANFVRGNPSKLGFRPLAMRDGMILSTEGQVFRLDSKTMIEPRDPEGFSEEARTFAHNGRWLELPDRLVDLHLGQAITGIIPSDDNESHAPRLHLVDRDGVGWCLRENKFDKFDRDDTADTAYAVSVWPIPDKPSKLDDGTLRLWAEVLIAYTKDRDKKSRRLSESEWDNRRSILAERLAQSGLRLPGFDPADRRYWLRNEINRLYLNMKEDDRCLSLANRLVAEEPSGRNYLWRSRIRKRQGEFKALRDRRDDYAGALRDLMAAVDAPLAGGWALEYSVYASNIVWNLLQDTKSEAGHQLVLDYLARRKAAGRPPLDPEAPEIFQPLALYRVGRFDESAKALEAMRIGESIETAECILVRAMALKKLGREAEAQRDYEAARTRIASELEKGKDWSAHRWLHEEADKLFGKP